MSRTGTARANTLHITLRHVLFHVGSARYCRLSLKFSTQRSAVHWIESPRLFTLVPSLVQLRGTSSRIYSRGGTVCYYPVLQLHSEQEKQRMGRFISNTRFWALREFTVRRIDVINNSRKQGSVVKQSRLNGFRLERFVLNLHDTAFCTNNTVLNYNLVLPVHPASKLHN